MRRIILSLASLLLLAGCDTTRANRDLQWWATMTAADQAAREKRSAAAEAQWRQALAEAEQSGLDDWRVAHTLQRMARFYESQGRRDEAEEALKRTLAIEEKIGARGPTAARTLTDLAHLYHSEGRYSEAERLYQRALPMAVAAFGADHRNEDVIRLLLARLYAAQGRDGEAEPLYQQIVAGKTFDPLAVQELAQLYETQGRYAEAEPLRRRLVTHKETAGSPRELAAELGGLAALLRKMDRPAEASEIEARALAVFPEDKVEILALTSPEARRTVNGSTEFEMTATVQYTLRSADVAALQVSAVRFQSAGCNPYTPSMLYPGSLLPITRGEGRRVVPVKWVVRPGGAGSPGPGEGYVTVRSAMWSDPPDHQRRLIRSFGQPRAHCHALQVAGSGQPAD
jgi:tetratricopeptide (TPR) repeat protein